MSDEDSLREAQRTEHGEQGSAARHDTVQTSGGALLQWLRDAVPVVGAFMRRNSIPLVAGLLGRWRQ